MAKKSPPKVAKMALLYLSTILLSKVAPTHDDKLPILIYASGAHSRGPDEENRRPREGEEGQGPEEEEDQGEEGGESR